MGGASPSGAQGGRLQGPRRRHPAVQKGQKVAARQRARGLWPVRPVPRPSRWPDVRLQDRQRPCAQDPCLGDRRGAVRERVRGGLEVQACEREVPGAARQSREARLRALQAGARAPREGAQKAHGQAGAGAPAHPRRKVNHGSEQAKEEGQAQGKARHRAHGEARHRRQASRGADAQRLPHEARGVPPQEAGQGEAHPRLDSHPAHLPARQEDPSQDLLHEVQGSEGNARQRAFRSAGSGSRHRSPAQVQVHGEQASPHAPPAQPQELPSQRRPRSVHVGAQDSGSGLRRLRGAPRGHRADRGSAEHHASDPRGPQGSARRCRGRRRWRDRGQGGDQGRSGLPRRRGHGAVELAAARDGRPQRGWPVWRGLVPRRHPDPADHRVRLVRDDQPWRERLRHEPVRGARQLPRHPEPRRSPLRAGGGWLRRSPLRAGGGWLRRLP